jgi:CRISPR-associated protein Csb1
VSEIAAIGVPVKEGPIDPRTGEIEVRTAGQRTGSRIDPLGILRKVEIYQNDSKEWNVDAAVLGARTKKVRPSEINHGNITPSVQPLGITCDYVEHTAVLSFAGLRRLGFGGREKDAVAQALLAALGILALIEQDARGYALRSRCDLVCDGRAPLERVKSDGLIEPIQIDRKAARELYAEAVAAARKSGVTISATPIKLVPQPKLVAIVKQSQEIAMAGQGGEPEGE